MTGPGLGLELDCATLAPQATVEAALNPATVPVSLAFDGAGGHYTLAQIGLAQAGALRCEWSDGGTVGEFESYLQISVLPEAAQLWTQYSGDVALFQTTANGFGDASFHSCQNSSGYSSCRVDVLIADRWMSVIAAGLQSTDTAAPLIEAAITSIRAASAGTTRPSMTTSTCDDLLSSDDVSATLGTEVEPWDKGAPTQPVLYHAGFIAGGGVLCAWRNSFSSASAMTAELSLLPQGSWAWESYWGEAPSDRVVRAAVDGLGDAAFSGCAADSPCFVSVLSGDTWFDIVVNDESSEDETAVATELARLVLASIDR